MRGTDEGPKEVEAEGLEKGSEETDTEGAGNPGTEPYKDCRHGGMVEIAPCRLPREEPIVGLIVGKFGKGTLHQVQQPPGGEQQSQNGIGFG